MICISLIKQGYILLKILTYITSNCVLGNIDTEEKQRCQISNLERQKNKLRKKNEILEKYVVMKEAELETTIKQLKREKQNLIKTLHNSQKHNEKNTKCMKQNLQNNEQIEIKNTVTEKLNNSYCDEELVKQIQYLSTLLKVQREKFDDEMNVVRKACAEQSRKQINFYYIMVLTIFLLLVITAIFQYLLFYL